MAEVNEKSTSIITLTFKDDEDNAVVPTSCTYRIDDVNSKTSILGDTIFVPSSSVHDLTITSEQNAIVRNGKTETHELTVEFTYSGGKKGTDSFLFDIVNLEFVA